MNRNSFSVVIPAYNRAATLPVAVRSALGQSRSPLEVVIVDDGSTDETGDVARSFGSPAVRYVKTPNAGAAAARNVGIRESRGDVLAFLDSDDAWETEKLEIHAAAHARWPQLPRVRQFLAYPYGLYDARSLEIAHAAGMGRAFTVEPRIPIRTEFPMRIPRMCVQNGISVPKIRRGLARSHRAPQILIRGRHPRLPSEI